MRRQISFGKAIVSAPLGPRSKSIILTTTTIASFLTPPSSPNGWVFKTSTCSGNRNPTLT